MRFSYGGDLAGWHVGYGETAIAAETGLSGRVAIALGGVNVQFWSAATGGTQYTDLQNAEGTPVSEIQTSPGTADYPLGVLPQFYGPDGVPSMYAQPGSGPRLRVTAVDSYNYFADDIGDVASLQSAMDALGTRVDTVETQQATVASTVATLSPAVTDLETWRRYPVAELRPSAQTTLTSSAYTTILFGAETFDADQDNVGGHSTTTNTGRYTIRYAGLYLIAGAITYSAGSAGSRYTRWLINGLVRPSSGTFNAANPAGVVTVHAPSIVQWLLVGDYIELQGMQSSGASISTYAIAEYNSHMTVVYLRPVPPGSPT
jgi:hypothetical protein